MNLAKFKKHNRYIVVFCVKEANSYSFMEFRNIAPNTTTIKYDKDNLFVIDIENPTYRSRETRYFCIDINGKQLYFKDLKSEDIISSKVNKMIMSDQIIYQLAKATTTPINQPYDWKTAIIFTIIGSLIGFIVKIFVPI